MDTKIGIYVIISAFIVASCADLLTYYFELKRKRKQERIIYKMKKLNMIRNPIDPKYKNFSLDEFIHYEKYEKSKLATWAYKLNDEEDDDEVNLFSFMLDYYWFCKEDLKSYKNEILELWNAYFDLLENSNETNFLRNCLNQLCSLTINSGFTQEEREKIDTKLLRILEKHYRNLLDNQDFNMAITKILEWYYYRTDYYYEIMSIGTTESELYFLEQIYNNFEKEIEQLKSDSPPTFLSFTGVVYYFYIKLPKYRDRNYDQFYRYIMLNRIAVLRNIGEYEQMSNTIFKFYKGQQQKKKSWRLLWDYVLDLGTGYGEKPLRLLILFLILQIIFFFVFYPYPNSQIKLDGINEKNNIFENSIDVLYFNMTTMLSNLYGNIPPANWLAKFIVIIEQIVGFIVSGSFIALFLRKLFRH
jgi:hypothetical protein